MEGKAVRFVYEGTSYDVPLTEAQDLAERLKANEGSLARLK
jgi:hypothetical protein